MNYRKFLIAALLVMSFSVQAKDITITRLTCEMREGRVTISDAPRLGWQMSSPENGTRQTAYEIEVRDVWAGKVVWNSGKVKSARSQLVSCADAALEKDRHYTWRVRVWDEADTPSAWSAPSDFSILTSEAAFAGSEWIGAITRKDARIPEGRKYHGSELKKPEAKAAWAAVDTLAKKSIYLRREFHVAKKVKDATAYVCGLGFYEFSLNGEKVGDSEFAPLWSDYDKSVYYNTYDVTSQVKKGGNAIGVLLGNGFYNVQGGRYAFCCSLAWLRSLRTVLRTSLFPFSNTGSIQCSTYQMITYTRQILHTSTTDHYDRVFLQIMTFSRNISIHFFSVG